MYAFVFNESVAKTTGVGDYSNLITALKESIAGMYRYGYFVEEIHANCRSVVYKFTSCAGQAL